jgi:hypothetical protein
VKRMPQEISVSYQAIKSKVYRLVDSLVVGEKTESEVQESVRRWWELIHPADRPIAQKYLLAVLGHSTVALEAIGDGLAAATESQLSRSAHSSKVVPLQQIVKHAPVGTAV